MFTNKRLYSTVPMPNGNLRPKNNTYCDKELVPEYPKNSELIEAILNGDIDEIRSILKRGTSDINKLGSDCLSPIELVINKRQEAGTTKEKYVDIFKLLVDYGVGPEIQGDYWQSTILHIAVKKQNRTFVEYLLSKNHDYFVSDNKGSTPIVWAVVVGNLDIYKLFYTQAEKDDRMNHFKNVTMKGDFAIHIACKEGYSDIVEFLLSIGTHSEYMKRSQNKSWTPLQLASKGGHYRCCELLLDAAGENKTNYIQMINPHLKTTALIDAAEGGHYNVIRLLSDSDVNYQDAKLYTALHYACQNSHTISVGLLLTMGADPYIKNSHGLTCFHVAAKYTVTECLKKLLPKANGRVPSSKEKRTVLHVCARESLYMEGFTDSIILLAKNPIFKLDINELDKREQSPFHLVLMSGNLKAFEAMLENGANPYLFDGNRKNTGMHLAAKHGTVTICRLLYNYDEEHLNMTINMKNRDGETPLHCAISNKNEDQSFLICKYFMFKKARLNITNFNGDTALSVAVKMKRPNLIKLFIKNEALRNDTVDPRGDTLLHQAARIGDLESCQTFFQNCISDLDKRNRVDLLPIDIAFIQGNVEIFELFLSRTQFAEKHSGLESFQRNVHRFMHVALEQRKRDFVEVLVKSEWWWYCALFPEYGRKDFCPNFRYLIQFDSQLACVALQKCISLKDNEETYNFRLFEDTHVYKRFDDSSGTEIHDDPFIKETGRLKTTATRLNPVPIHPLRVAVDFSCYDILVHPLTQAYLKEKWINTGFIAYFSLLFVELFSLTTQALHLCYSIDSSKWNVSSCNITDEDVSRFVDTAEYRSNYYMRQVLAILMYFVIFIHLALEINFVCKVRIEWSSFLGRVARILGLVLFSIPMQCFLALGVKVGFQWVIGCITFLISGCILIFIINELTIISISMPVTRNFLFSFFKVVCHILMILFLFSIIFHVLLYELEDFSTILSSLIKSLVWLLGDLAFNDTFIENKNVYYINTAILMFVIFVTTVGIFAVNALVSMPANHFDDLKEQALIASAANRAVRLLNLDASFGPTYIGYSKNSPNDKAFSVLFYERKFKEKFLVRRK